MSDINLLTVEQSIDNVPVTDPTPEEQSAYNYESYEKEQELKTYYESIPDDYFYEH